MYKIILATIISATLVLYPANASAPATGGNILELSSVLPQPISEFVIDTQINSKSLVNNIVSNSNLELDLILPLAGPSIHTDYTGPLDEFHWKDQNSGQYHIYGVENGKFIYQAEDTWFVYGLFGPIEATKYDWNIQYDLWDGNHNGIDFAVALNTPVLASSGGEVIFAGVSAGNTIIINKDNFYITYSHLNSFWVKVGDTITQGQIIGLTGDSGTINPHLHLQVDEYKNDGSKWGINPAKYLPSLNQAIIPNTPTNQLIEKIEEFNW